MRKLNLSYVNDEYARLFVKKICEMTCVDVSVAYEIEKALSNIIDRWEILLLTDWNKTYFTDNLRDTNLVRNSSIIDCMDLKTVVAFINDVNYMLDGMISENIIFYEFIHFLLEWENCIFHEWKMFLLKNHQATLSDTKGDLL